MAATSISAVVLGMLNPVWIASRESGATWDVLLSELAIVSPFIIGLVAVPALLGGLLGSALRTARSPGRSPA
jgi:hypothetical protein